MTKKQKSQVGSKSDIDKVVSPLSAAILIVSINKNVLVLIHSFVTYKKLAHQHFFFLE